MKALSVVYREGFLGTHLKSDPSGAFPLRAFS